MTRQNVLDHGYIELQEVMGGDKAVVQAARICCQSKPKGGGADQRLIENLMKHRHNTVFEHAVLRFQVRCPLFVARQWMRHRAGVVFNERSLRYCAADRLYYVPGMNGYEGKWLQEALRDLREQGRTLDALALRDQYLVRTDTDLLDRHARYIVQMEQQFDLYEYLTTTGYPDWPREQARGLLGTAVYTEFLWTVNAWALMHWMRRRLDRAAQREHREYARAALDLFWDVMPWTAGAFEQYGLGQGEAEAA